jgi:hypothetical protein
MNTTLDNKENNKNKLSLSGKISHFLNVIFPQLSLESRIKIEKILNKKFKDPSNLIKDNDLGISIIESVFNKKDFFANIPKGSLDSFVLDLKELIERDRLQDGKYEDYNNLETPNIKVIKNDTEIGKEVFDFKENFDKIRGNMNILKSNNVYVFYNINEILTYLSEEALLTLIFFVRKNQIIFAFDNGFDASKDRLEDEELDRVMDHLFLDKNPESIIKMSLNRNGIVA